MYQYVLKHIYFIQLVIIHHHLLHFVVQLAPALANGAPLRWFLLSFEVLLSFFKHFFTFWYNKMLQDHLILSLPTP